MSTVDLICLANSNKWGGRCVAGLRSDGRGWVRPVAPDTTHGELYSQHLRLEDNSTPEVLDLLRVDLKCAKPSPSQPENWVIARKQWILISRPAGPELHMVLRGALVRGPRLLGSTGRCVSAIAASDVSDSLALVIPLRFRCYIQRELGDRPQPRAIFELTGTSYDLPITDPAWTSRIVRKLLPLEPRTYPQEAIGIPEQSLVLFTISLGEPFNGYCYKLVAGIIVSSTPSAPSAP